MLLWGAIGMSISQLIVAICGTLSTGQYDNGEIFIKNLGGQRAAVAFVCIYISIFAATWGSPRLGGDRGDLPTQDTSQISQHHDRYKLATQLGSSLFHPEHGQLWRRKRKLAVQDLFCVVWLLFSMHCICLVLHLRDKGA